VPCETQDPPDLHSEIGSAPASSPTSKNPLTASPEENALTKRYADIVSQLTDVKQLKAAGKDNAAKSLLDTVLQQFTGWNKDWTAFQRSNGIKSPLPQPSKGAKG
jgi:hypothetical protein